MRFSDFVAFKHIAFHNVILDQVRDGFEIDFQIREQSPKFTADDRNNGFRLQNLPNGIPIEEQRMLVKCVFGIGCDAFSTQQEQTL
jgi:hypothetical protein